MKAHAPVSPAQAAVLILLLTSTGTAAPGPGARQAPPPPARALEPSPLALPAGPGARWPSLASGADGELYATWVEPVPADRAGAPDPAGELWTLAVARLEGGGWRRLADAATGRDWFVNWADFPAVAALAEGTLATFWLAKSDAGTYEYEVLASLSGDGGAGWSAPFCLHADRRPAEHGFVSLAPFGERFVAVWLDGRATVDGGAMQLRARTVAPRRDGEPGAGPLLGPEVLIDERVCDCCQTAVVGAGRGVAVAWRDRDEDEVRDMSWLPLGAEVLSGAEARVPRPRPVASDGWKVPGCPVNGPALARAGDTLLAAWFTTGAEDRPRVLVRSLARGEPGPVQELTAQDPLGRVDLVFDGTDGWVSWLERTGEESAAWMLTRVDPELGELERSVLVELDSAGRDTGFGRLALHDGALYFVWTEPAAGSPSEGGPSAVRCLRLP